MGKQWKARTAWSTVAWFAFVGLMVVRVGWGVSSGGPGTVVLTYVAIGVGAVALFALAVALLRAQRRPISRTVAAIRDSTPGVVAGQVFGSNDLYLGLKLAGFGAATEGPARLRQVFAVAVSATGVEFWSGRSAGPEVKFEASSIVDLKVALADNPAGRRPSVVLTIRTDRDIILPFVVINESGTGAMPMNEERTKHFASQARVALELTLPTTHS